MRGPFGAVESARSRPWCLVRAAVSFLLAVVLSTAISAEPLLYRFDLTVDVDSEDPVHLRADVPVGESRILPITSHLQFEVSAPASEGMATTVRLIDTSGVVPKALHTEKRDWPASVERKSTYETCDGQVVLVTSERENSISFDRVAPVTAKCEGYSSSRLTRPPAEWRTLSDVSSFLSNVRSAASVTVYEGLPHQTWDNAAYLDELKRADLVLFESFPFYDSPLRVSQQEKTRLTQVVLDGDAHVTYRGPKLCGGYHPDYAVVWERAGNKSGALFCFGCHEVIYFTPQGRLIQELGDTAYWRLKAVLSRYRVNRPKGIAQ